MRSAAPFALTLVLLVHLLASCGDGTTSANLDSGLDASPPDFSSADFPPPDLARPDARPPDRSVPDQAAPDQRVPDQLVPDQLAPDQTVPDQLLPDQMIPDQLVPDQMIPDQLVPDQMIPDQLVPDQMIPDQMIPDQLIPDQMIPDMPWPTCNDKLKNQDETDVDCGGATCPPCAVGKTCKLPADCASKTCFQGICIDPKGTTCSGGTVQLHPGGGFKASRVHATAAAMLGVGSIAGDGKGTLYGQDPYGNGVSGDRVLRVTAAGAVSTLVAPGGLSTCTVSQITADATGHLYLYNITSSFIMKISAATGGVTNWVNLASVGGGGSCTNTSVIALAARADGSLVAGSPKLGRIYQVPKAGKGWTPWVLLSQPMRMDHDGAGGVYATSKGKLMHVTAAKKISTFFDPTAGPGSAASLRRDSNGDVYFLAGNSLYKLDSAGANLTPVAGCLGSTTDLEFDKSTAAAPGGESIYISDIGKGIFKNDGDRILELQR